MNLMILLLFLCIHFQNPNPAVHSLSDDGLSLLSLKSAIDQSSSDVSVFENWNEDDTDPCHWSGISCMRISGSNYPRVVGVSIAGKNLRGYIPSELGNLVYLRRLNIHDNNFYGSIPTPLFNATALHSLFLYGNNLSGTLPPMICNLPRLQNLDLSSNSFSGPLSTDLKNCNQLQKLVLANNKFSGEIPSGIWSALVNLVQLDLSSNNFSGAIPEDLGELKSLSGTLNLSNNQITGQLPKSLGNLPLTVSFDLRNNNLTGEIPKIGAFANQGPMSFLNNPSLCGFPLQKPCNQFQESQTENQSSSSPGSNNHNSSRKGLKPGLIILISVADAAVVTFIGLIIVYIYWKKKDSNSCSCTGEKKLGGIGNNNRFQMCSCICSKGFSNHDSETDISDKESASGGSRGEGALVAIDKGFSFELDELLRASAYVLGKSGHGIVYKVVLGNGIPVAVRRLGEGGEQRYKEFAAEIQSIGKVKHPNIVKLRAYYWASDEKLLISDFIANGNLAFALHGRTGQPSTSLSWTIRLKIAKGIARGIAYLHECSPKKLVHGDIKPSNILLDHNFQPFISDFGLNRLITITETNNNPPSSGGYLGGSLPYLKPTLPTRINNKYKPLEARNNPNNPTQKWDVYSFGVILLELITGKSVDLSLSTSTSSSFTMEDLDLVKWVRKSFEEEKPFLDIVDPMFVQEVHAKKEVLALFHVALACTEDEAELRPRMKNVSENLERIGL